MPFTFSHPAAVLPFLKNNKVSATGLVIGTMCPDFEYFIRMKVQSSISHSFLGLFFFNLPIGFLAALLFHYCIKGSLIDNLPAFIKKRLQALKNSNWADNVKKHFFKIAVSILIGAGSHIIWDSFTHETGYFVDKIPFLQLKIRNVAYYKIAQHLSSLIGMLFIVCFLFQMPVEEESAKPHYLKYWSLVIFFTFVFFTARLAFGLSLMQIGNAVVSLISSVILAITLVGLLFKSKRVRI